jgi:hypothetical protein
MQLVKPLPFAEAINKLGSRSLIGSKLSSSEWSDVPVALRERAFFSSRVESARVLQRARNGIADFLQSNRDPDAQDALRTGSRADFVKQMQDFLSAEGIERSSGGLRDITSEKRLGLIFNTQTQQANDYGYWRQGQDPDVLDAFPAQRFIRVLEVKEPRDNHTQYEGQVFLKSDPVWSHINEDFGVPWGPWGWGCGHDVEDVSREDAEALGLLTPGQAVEPDTRHFNENLKASTQGLEPDLIEKLKADLGDQLEIDGTAMRWAVPAENTPAPANVPTPTPPTPATPPATPPAPLPPAAPAEQAKVSKVPKAPVSKALEVKVTGTHKRAVNEALASIDRVHDDGVLPPIRIDGATGKGNLGVFRSVRTLDGRQSAKGIGIRRSGTWPSLTTAHEVGHLLDLEGIGAKGQYATRQGFAPMKKVMEAAAQTQSIKALHSMRAGATDKYTLRHCDYFLQPHEIWARSYAQFIAERSGSEVLKQELQLVHDTAQNRQWSREDFAPIRQAIETMFKELGWL